MPRSRVAITTVLFAVLSAATVAAQGLVTQQAMSADLALDLAKGALENCRAKGYRVSVTVVNAEGLMKAFVRDDGAGIPAELLASVFDLFVEGERTPARSEGGLGMGLTTVRRLTEASRSDSIAW